MRQSAIHKILTACVLVLLFSGQGTSSMSSGSYTLKAGNFNSGCGTRAASGGSVARSDTLAGIFGNASSAAYKMNAGGAGTIDTNPPSSMIILPVNLAILTGVNYSITGSADDAGGTGVQYVDVSTDGGRTWQRATGATSWSYCWTLPSSGGVRHILSRATDNAWNIETPGQGITVTVTPYTFGSPELPHFNWNAAMIPGGNDCSFCHMTPGTFLIPDFKQDPGFCMTCHNAAGNGHELGIYSSRGQHPMFANATTMGRKRPTFGSITAGERNDIPASRLKDGYQVTCMTCHNAMRKSDDPGRVWEYTTTPDRYKYFLQNGGWSAYGNMTPKVYRDTSLWQAGGPTYSKVKKSYQVDPSEYTYDETAGAITFNTEQDPTVYIYATLDYPYLRAPMQDNALCFDCHTEATHKDNNCLNCHQAHNTGNLKGIREKVRASNFTTVAVKFLRYTGANSFTDGDSTHDGICEVCHTNTKYYKRDGSGFANHSGGLNYDRTNCTTCHSHSTGFSK